MFSVGCLLIRLAFGLEEKGSLGELFEILKQLGGSLGMCIKIRLICLVTKEPLPSGAGIDQP